MLQNHECFPCTIFSLWKIHDNVFAMSNCGFWRHLEQIWYLEEGLFSMTIMSNTCFWKKASRFSPALRSSVKSEERTRSFFQSESVTINTADCRMQLTCSSMRRQHLFSAVSCWTIGDSQPDLEQVNLPFYRKQNVYSLFLNDYETIQLLRTVYCLLWDKKEALVSQDQSNKDSSLCKVFHLRKDWPNNWSLFCSSMPKRWS